MSTQNIIGTPVSSWASWMPREVSAGHVIVVRCFAAQHAPDANDRVAASGSGEFFCGDGNFKRARHTYYLDLLLGGTGARQRIERAGKKTVGDETVELAYDDSEMQPARIESCPEPRSLPTDLASVSVPETSPAAFQGKRECLRACPQSRSKVRKASLPETILPPGASPCRARSLPWSISRRAAHSR